MKVHAQRQLFCLERKDWETPLRLFEDLDREFGFTLDVCATADNAKVPRYYSVEDDGLRQDWGSQVCWMNPPYGSGLSSWVRKAKDSAQSGATVVALLPVRSDTAWWHDYVLGAEIRFVRGRLRFGGASRDAPFPSAIVVWRPR